MMMPNSDVPDSVTGSSSDIAEIGPIPGSTPTRVPIKTPIKQYSRLTGCRATPKPWATLRSTSMFSVRSADFEDARGQLDRERALENPPHGEWSEDGKRNGQRPAYGIDHAQQQHHQRNRGEKESERIERKSERGEARDDQ